jgi:hypothetical protein
MTANRLIGVFAVSAISVATVGALVFMTVTAAVTGFALVMGSQAYAGEPVVYPAAITVRADAR